MGKYYILFCLFPLLMSSCSNEGNETPYVMQSPPVGCVFEDGGISIKFETLNTVSFYSTDYSDSKGTAKYIFKDGVVQILNPYGRRLKKEETAEAYFLGFDGEFTSPNRMKVHYFFVGKNEVQQITGSGSTMCKIN
jgi:hypothetical protein